MPAPDLTIGMATFDDFDGVYFTVTSLMLHHADVMRECEIIVVDNNPASRQGRFVRDWMRANVPHGTYHAFESPTGTAAPREMAFRLARGRAVLCLDCHVLLAPGAVHKLIQYYRSHPDSLDLLTGPLLTDSGRLAATHQRPQWSRGAWGVWALDERGRDPRGEPFEIWQQGLGLFSCRKEAWVGFHPGFRGGGGCESYIMEKVRKNGGRVLCCPWLRWTHRFPRPCGPPYEANEEDRLRNYVLGFQELGLDLDPVVEHFRVSREYATSLAGSIATGRCAGDVAVVGDPRYVGVQLRGRILADHLGCELITPEQVPGMSPRQTIIAIKTGFCPRLVRARCDRLIYDPLDVFSDSCARLDAVDYWRAQFHKRRFDEIIATSPACRDVMREALPDNVRVHVVPHSCDPRIEPTWRDPAGPVVYAGLEVFIRSGLDRIRRACRQIGKAFAMAEGCDVLRGASLALAMRLPPFDTELYRRCKPQIKLENAAAAGLPVVATDCPAARSLHPEIETVPVDFTESELAGAIQRALGRPAVSRPYTRDAYLSDMDRLLRRQRLVVYTAIFGGYDELREPCERAPGVHYVCFTDNPHLRSDVWEVRYCQPSGDPLFQARRFKVLAHEVLDCDLSLWIDGRVELQALNGIFGRLETGLAVPGHPRRNCIYVEAGYCKQARRGDPVRIDEAVARYRAEGFPRGSGLWMTGVMVRRHGPETTAFNREWWHEVSQGTSRDQISFPVVARRLGLPVTTLPRDVPRFRVGTHLK